jgi:hypothetical protein
VDLPENGGGIPQPFDGRRVSLGGSEKVAGGAARAQLANRFGGARTAARDSGGGREATVKLKIRKTMKREAKLRPVEGEIPNAKYFRFLPFSK